MDSNSWTAIMHYSFIKYAVLAANYGRKKELRMCERVLRNHFCLVDASIRLFEKKKHKEEPTILRNDWSAAHTHKSH